MGWPSGAPPPVLQRTQVLLQSLLLLPELMVLGTQLLHPLGVPVGGMSRGGEVLLCWGAPAAPPRPPPPMATGLGPGLGGVLEEWTSHGPCLTQRAHVRAFKATLVTLACPRATHVPQDYYAGFCEMGVWGACPQVSRTHGGAAIDSYWDRVGVGLACVDAACPAPGGPCSLGWAPPAT